MKKNPSKYVRVLLSLALIISCMPMLAYADPVQPIDDVNGVAVKEDTEESQDVSGAGSFDEGLPSEEEASVEAEVPALGQQDGEAAPVHEDMSIAGGPSTGGSSVAHSAPAGFTELGDVVNYPSNPFHIKIYSDGLRCGRSDADKVTFKFVPETTANEFGYQVINISRYDADGLNAVYDTSFGSPNAFSPDDSFSFNFVSSGRYQIGVQVMAKGGAVSADANSSQEALRFARISANFSIDDPAYPSTEKIADDVAQQCLNAGNKTDYDKALWLHDWLIRNCKYDHGYNYANAEGALVRGLGTCEAYHRAYVMLLDRVGIQSGRITGNGHVWTAVKLDGEWHQVDVTWDDIDYEPHAQFPEERYLYFGLNDSLMGLAHSDHDRPVAGYASNSLKSNYLVRSGAIKKYSSSYVSEIQRKIDAGERSFSLQAVNSSWPASLDNAKSIVNGIVAYDLGSSSWATHGKGVSLSVAYSNGSFAVRAIVDGEIDSIPYYPGLHTHTGALRYGKPNGKYAQNEWLKLNGSMYYFKADGSAAISQNCIDGKDYHFWSNGQMASNCIWGGHLYQADGVMAKGGWLFFKGARYYAYQDGSLAFGPALINGKDYLFWSNYQMASNSIWSGHLYQADGVMAKGGWLFFKGARYYAYQDGSLACGAVAINGKDYLFWSNYQMASSRVWGGRFYQADGSMVKGSWILFKGARYHADQDGDLARGATVINGKDYLFWSNHQMASHCIWGGRIYGLDGVMAKNRWYTLRGARYYVGSDGSLAFGSRHIGGRDYYFWSNGQMAANVVYAGKIYGPAGYALSNAFFDYKGERFYAKQDGTIAIHALRIGDDDYYFWSNGVMVRNRMYNARYYGPDGAMARSQWVDGERYWVDANGVWIPNMPAKVGWQNPRGYYQVSSKSMHMPAGYYATPTRIDPYATRDECIEAFIGRAWDYIGTPYVWNYSDAPGVGVDCIGLVYQCAYACGMDLGEFNPYDHWITGPNGWHSHDANNMWNYGSIQRLSLGSRQRGDLIFWRGHVAIYLGGDRIIEAYPGTVRECSLWAHGTPIGVGRLFL